EQGLVDLDAVADLLEPAGDGSFGHGLAELGKGHVGCVTGGCGGRCSGGRCLGCRCGCGCGRCCCGSGCRGRGCGCFCGCAGADASEDCADFDGVVFSCEQLEDGTGDGR